jgi:hypothetical protein
MWPVPLILVWFVLSMPMMGKQGRSWHAFVLLRLWMNGGEMMFDVSPNVEVYCVSILIKLDSYSVIWK